MKADLYPHVSIDCVVFGIENAKLHVLLIERQANDETSNKERILKLPGSLLYAEEDLDESAIRILEESTGIKSLPLKQFKAFGNPHRVSATDSANLHWLEHVAQQKIGRVVTIGYVALCKIDRSIKREIGNERSRTWVPFEELPHLPFDHNEIINEARQEIAKWLEAEPAICFDMLPTKFTVTQIREIYSTINQTTYDLGNFYKRVAQMIYIVPTDEWQENVGHRAARYYKFKRTIYNKQRK